MICLPRMHITDSLLLCFILPQCVLSCYLQTSPSWNLLLLLILTIPANAALAHTMCKGLYKHSHSLTHFSLIQLSEVGTTTTPILQRHGELKKFSQKLTKLVTTAESEVRQLMPRTSAIHCHHVN